MRGVNDSVDQLLDLCFALLDGAGIMPYYFYMCDMIPFTEHWRVRQRHSSCSTESWATCLVSPPRASPAMCRSSASVGCTRSTSTTTCSACPTGRRTTAPGSRRSTLTRRFRRYEYYDPIDTLPPEGQAWWTEHGMEPGERGSRGCGGGSRVPPGRRRPARCPLTATTPLRGHATNAPRIRAGAIASLVITGTSRARTGSHLAAWAAALDGRRVRTGGTLGRV